jgi:hypothetical protein
MSKTFNFVVPDEVVARMKLVQERTEAPNLTEVVRRSLAVYDLLTETLTDDRVEDGVVLIPLKKGGFIELDLFPEDEKKKPS